MNECNIVKDLMPLYEEELLSEDSLEFIRRHAANCPQCRKALQHDVLPDIQSQNPVSERKIIKKALRRDRLKTTFKTLITVFLVLAIPVCYALQSMYEWGFFYSIEASYPSPDGTCVLELVDRDMFNAHSDGYMVRFKLDRDGGGGINRYMTDWDTIEPHWAPNGTDLLLLTTNMEGQQEIYIVDTSEHHHKGGTYEIPDMTGNLIPALIELCREQADFQNIHFTFHSWQEDSKAVVFSYETDQGQSGEITYHYTATTSTDAQ